MLWKNKCSEKCSLVRDDNKIWEFFLWKIDGNCIGVVGGKHELLSI